MKKAETRRAAIVEKLADHVLEHGLESASLRPLAKAAGTSDRMLLYYFDDKSAIVTATLQQIAARMMGEMSRRSAPAPESCEKLLVRLEAMLDEEIFWPYMRLWLEIAARAARGDGFYRNLGEALGRGFLEWGKMQLDSKSEQQRKAEAAYLLQTIEGMLFLKAIGLDDVNAVALGPDSPRKAR